MQEKYRRRFERVGKTFDSKNRKTHGKLDINGSFNNTINNINLLSYHETDVSHLTDEDRGCINKLYHFLKTFIDKVHFNPETHV